MHIAEDDPRAPDIRELLERHLAFARAPTPPEDAHALDLDGLLDPSVTFFSLREGHELLGIGAIKRLTADHFELKSMHTAERARRRGIGTALVDHLVAAAVDRGARRVSLETGSMEEFAPSRALYEKAGFEECAPFGAYRPSTNSTFMTRRLA